MISGSIILIDDHIEDKLDGLEWNRKDGHFKLKSLIQYNQNNLSVGGKRIKTTLKARILNCIDGYLEFIWSQSQYGNS
jgi:hypothetical protein